MAKLYVMYGNLMSRIGKQPISIPEGVNIDVKESLVTVKGPKGSLDIDLCMVQPA